MGEQDLQKILLTFDAYIAKLENPHVAETITEENAKKLMDLCAFVETAVARALDENKAERLESHLKARRSRDRDGTAVYTISQLEKACDGMLEVCLKDRQVSSGAIDKLFQYYINCCGNERLNDLLVNLLVNSASTNIVVQSLIDLGVSEIAIEDEIILEAWKNEAAIGKCAQVTLCIRKMLEDGEFGKIIDYAMYLEDDSVVKKLIMQRLVDLASDYEANFFAFLADTETKVLRDLLKNTDFQTYFFDGIFYFARNMTLHDNSWRSENAFNYERLVGTLKNVARASDELNEIVAERMERANVSSESPVWIDVERDMTESSLEGSLKKRY